MSSYRLSASLVVGAALIGAALSSVSFAQEPHGGRPEGGRPEGGQPSAPAHPGAPARPGACVCPPAFRGAAPGPAHYDGRGQVLDGRYQPRPLLRAAWERWRARCRANTAPTITTARRTTSAAGCGTRRAARASWWSRRRSASRSPSCRLITRPCGSAASRTTTRIMCITPGRRIRAATWWRHRRRRWGCSAARRQWRSRRTGGFLCAGRAAGAIRPHHLPQARSVEGSTGGGRIRVP